MVTLRRYLNLWEAERDRSLLEAANIPSFLSGENSASAGYGSVLGELQLQVQEADVQRARQILDKHEGFAPLPDDFIPPEDRPEANPGLEKMGTDTRNIMMSVAVTLLIVFAALALFNRRTPSTREGNDAAWRAYEERARRAEAQLAAQEQTHERYVKFLTKSEDYQQRYVEILTRSEEDQRRFEKILATWERQQQEYQAYLDGLKEKSR